MNDLIHTRDFVICETHQDESMMDGCLHCRIEELEARDVASPEYLQSWIDRAQEAESQLEAAKKWIRSAGHYVRCSACRHGECDCGKAAIGEVEK